MRAEDRQAAWTGIALLRLGLVLVVGVGQALSSRGETRSYFAAAFLAATGYAILTIIAATRGFRPRWLSRTEPAADFLLLCLLTVGSGGPVAEMRKAFLALPVAAAFLSRPRTVAIWAVLAVTAFLLITVLSPESRVDASLRSGLVHSLYLGWAGAAAVVLSVLLTRRAERLAALADSRSRLISTSLDVRDRERRRLAQALHDEPVQALLAARQDLEEARAGDGAALGRAERALVGVVARLRDEISELHPPLLEASGLEAALEALCAQQARRGGYAVNLAVASRVASSRDPVTLALVRELLVNVTKHAAACHVRVEVMGFNDGGFRLEVADDGRGMTQDRRRRGALEGHIGLSSIEERVRARSGTVEIHSTPGAGTRVCITLPEQPVEQPRADVVLLQS